MKIPSIQRYLGYISVSILWITFCVCLSIHSPDLSEPASQYGYYSDTSLLFAMATILFSISHYLFSKKLNVYWQHSSRFAALGGIFFVFTGVIPYQPGVDRFVLDTHNVSIALSVIFYSLVMISIGYKKRHEKIARISRYLFFVMSILVATSFAARILGYSPFVWQTLAVVPFSIWIIIVNDILLKSDFESSQVPKKL